MTLHRNVLVVLVGLAALVLLVGFVPAPNVTVAGSGAALLAQVAEYQTGCAIVTEDQVSTAVGDGQRWFYLSDASDEIDAQGRLLDEDYLEAFGAAYLCAFEPADSLIRSLMIMYIVDGAEIFQELLEFTVDSYGEEMWARYTTPDRQHHQFFIDPEGLFREAVMLCSGGAVVQLSYSLALGDPANEALDRLGTLLCTL